MAYGLWIGRAGSLDALNAKSLHQPAQCDEEEQSPAKPMSSFGHMWWPSHIEASRRSHHKARGDLPMPTRSVCITWKEEATARQGLF